MKKPRSREEIQAALNRLCGEYDHYCGVSITSPKDAVDVTKDLVTTTQYRSKIKALYWALGEEEL